MWVCFLGLLALVLAVILGDEPEGAGALVGVLGWARGVWGAGWQREVWDEAWARMEGAVRGGGHSTAAPVVS